MPLCESCVLWKKDYGIWAHNRWTRSLSDRGWCLLTAPAVDRKGCEKACPSFAAAPERPVVFYAPHDAPARPAPGTDDRHPPPRVE